MKRNLHCDMYLDVEGFAADIKLILSDAMKPKPATKRVDDAFSMRCSSSEPMFKRDNNNVRNAVQRKDQAKVCNSVQKNALVKNGSSQSKISAPMQTLKKNCLVTKQPVPAKAPIPVNQEKQAVTGKRMPKEEKQKLRSELVDIAITTKTKFGLSNLKEERFINAADDNTLRRSIKGFLDAKVETAKVSKI